jgi:hypothetical protein
MFWKWIPRTDFKNGIKPRTLPRGIEPLGARFTDLRTPQETIQVIGDAKVPVPDFRVDLGKTDVFISDQAKTIRYTGGGENTNVGSRIPNTTQGMTVEGRKGHAYARKVYPKHSVSRTDMGTDEPVRGETSVSGVNRPKIVDDTKDILEGTYEEPPKTKPVTSKIEPSEVQTELLATGYGKETYFDEDPEWLEGLEPAILKTRKKTTSRAKISKQRPVRGKGSTATTMGGIRL